MALQGGEGLENEGATRSQEEEGRDGLAVEELGHHCLLLPRVVCTVQTPVTRHLDTTYIRRTLVARAAYRVVCTVQTPVTFYTQRILVLLHFVTYYNTQKSAACSRFTHHGM